MKANLISFSRLIIFLQIVLILPSSRAVADVSKEIVTEYENSYVNRAMFLKVPIRGERQTIFMKGSSAVPDNSTAGLPLSFLVGEQVRVTELKFRNNTVEFRISSIDGLKKGTLVFQFPAELEFAFTQRANFDKALNDSLTSGLSYREIESAKKEYIQEEFKRVAQQIATTTSTDNSFVMQAISTEIPEVTAALQGRDRAEKDLAELRARFEAADGERNQLNQQVRELRASLSKEQQRAGNLQSERDSLSRKGEGQQQELQRLRDENTRIKDQLSSLAHEMDVQVGSNSDLTGKVNTLSQSLQTMKDEWAALQKKIASTESELKKTRDERNKLTSDLSLAKRRVSQLETQLNSLTSNRNSLEATYVRTKNRLDNLELALKTSESLALNRLPLDSGAAKGTVSYAVNLLSRRIGTLVITPPRSILDQARASYTVESPDTVQFTEEERVMLASLGKDVRVKAVWAAMGGDLAVNLAGGEEIQAIAPRETAEWTWSFSGSLDSGEPVMLTISFLDENDNAVPAADLEFEIEPESIIPFSLRNSIWIPALAGFILGSLLAAILLRLTGGNGRKTKREKPRSEPAKYSTQKDL